VNQERSLAMTAVFEVVCQSLGQGLTGWVARAIKNSRMNFFVSVAIESALSLCPTVMDGVLPRR